MENFVNYTKIVDLKDGQRNLNVRAIILDLKCSKIRSNQEDFYKLVIADNSAKICCTLFEERVKLLKPGDIIYITRCYTKQFKDELTIYKHPNGNLIKIDEFCMVYNDKIDMSIKQELSNDQSKKDDQKETKEKKNINENKKIAVQACNRNSNKNQRTYPKPYSRNTAVQKKRNKREY